MLWFWSKENTGNTKGLIEKKKLRLMLSLTYIYEGGRVHYVGRSTLNDSYLGQFSVFDVSA